MKYTIYPFLVGAFIATTITLALIVAYSGESVEAKQKRDIRDLTIRIMQRQLEAYHIELDCVEGI